MRRSTKRASGPPRAGSTTTRLGGAPWPPGLDLLSVSASLEPPPISFCVPNPDITGARMTETDRKWSASPRSPDPVDATAGPLKDRDMVTASSTRASLGAIDSMEFRRALGHFATGVTVVTYVPDEVDEFRGTTVNSFTSVSLQPPLVLVSLGRQTRAAAALRPGSRYAVNVLHHGQRDLALHFAGRCRARGSTGRCGQACRTWPAAPRTSGAWRGTCTRQATTCSSSAWSRSSRRTGTRRCSSTAAPSSNCRPGRRPARRRQRARLLRRLPRALVGGRLRAPFLKAVAGPRPRMIFTSARPCPGSPAGSFSPRSVAAEGFL